MFGGMSLLAKAGVIVAAIALLASAYGVWHYKVAHDAVQARNVEIEREKGDAIDKANAARDRLRTLCLSNPVGCVPDDWFRD